VSAGQRACDHCLFVQLAPLGDSFTQPMACYGGVRWSRISSWTLRAASVVVCGDMPDESLAVAQVRCWVRLCASCPGWLGYLTKSRSSRRSNRAQSIDAQGINVKADRGKVTPSGRVRSLAERDGAEWAAWSAPGAPRSKTTSASSSRVGLTSGDGANELLIRPTSVRL
jgi:hypothetical protein